WSPGVATWSTCRAWGSRATAIPAPATCCGTRAGPRSVTCGSSTTSTRRWSASAPPVCPASSPTACSGGSDVPRTSTLGHWESYWRGHADLERTYSTGGRLAREVRKDGEVRGRPLLEVGAGSGRDTLELAGAGAIAVVLDY